jgi:hypothetical protein
MSFLSQGYCQSAKEDYQKNHIVDNLRDSLDKIVCPIQSLPAPSNNEVVLRIRNQNEWDNMPVALKKLLSSGCKNILVEVHSPEIVFGEKEISICDLDYPEVNVRVIGYRTHFVPFGLTFKKNDKNTIIEGDYYSFSYDDFSLNDLLVDNKGREIRLREDVHLIHGDIEAAFNLGNNIWRFKVDLPDLSENQCKDFYILLTREWTSGRHRVLKVEDRWLYFYLESMDLSYDNRNPNIDWQHFNVRPRYCFINNPVSEGVHIINGRIYVPKKVKSVKIIKAGCLVSFSSCRLNSLVISGFNINGCSDRCPISLYSCDFGYGGFIYDNKFKNLMGLAVYTGRSNNVTVSNNIIEYTREGAIECSGENITICENHLKNIGWMLNSRAIIGGGNRLHICDNIIEDFNYSAINCGKRIANSDDFILNYIIERNIIRYSEDYSKQFLSHTLADGGALYIGPQCTRGIIRNNVIYNITGIHSNRGIFLDDGAKNLAIYGNLIMNTSNSYDIDLRYTDSFADMIPDHNTNNSVFHNIITGGYRFQCKNGNSNCLGGNNILLQIYNNKRVVVDVSNMTLDIKLDGCRYNKGKIVIPRQNKFILDSINVDPFVRRYLSFKN